MRFVGQTCLSPNINIYPHGIIRIKLDNMEEHTVGAQYIFVPIS